MGKHKKFGKQNKRNKIPKNRDIEDIVYKEAEKNEQKENVIEKIEEQKQDFKEEIQVEIQVETTGQFKEKAQRRQERVLAEAAEEIRQIDYLKAVQKLQEEEELEP